MIAGMRLARLIANKPIASAAHATPMTPALSEKPGGQQYEQGDCGGD